MLRVLLKNFGLKRFPTACAVLIGGSTWLPLVCNRLLYTCGKCLGNISLLSSRVSVRLIRFLSALVSGWLAFQILNPNRAASPQDLNGKQQDKTTSDVAESNHGRGREQAGRTMDLTLFTATRALSIVAYIAWDRWKSRRKLQGRWTGIEALVPQIATAGIFAWSSAVVMWAWFYLPERLPRSYAKWITNAAEVDMRLIEALRRARKGDFLYGKDTGQAPLLQSMCADYGWPIEWGDPSKTVPMPCEMIHTGCGPSCEWHAISRFLRGFRFALATYLPVHTLLRLRSKRSAAALRQAVLGAARSSSFLALFIALFYYSVCLARTRLGPRLFDAKTVSPMRWDSGLCVGAGCITCGWSILFETPRRREEIALFVLPRAVATFLPRHYDREVCCLITTYNPIQETRNDCHSPDH